MDQMKSGHLPGAAKFDVLAAAALKPFIARVESLEVAYPGLIDSLNLPDIENAAAITLIEQLTGLIASERQSAIDDTVRNIKLELEPAKIQALLANSGGFFIGREQILKLLSNLWEKALGEAAKAAAEKACKNFYFDVEVSPIPKKFSLDFFNAWNPVGRGTIASSVILGFDQVTKQWFCFLKQVVPESEGLSVEKQNQFFRGPDGDPITVQGLTFSPLTMVELEPIKRILRNVVDFHLLIGKRVEDLPFRNIEGRTSATAILHRDVGFYTLRSYPTEVIDPRGKNNAVKVEVHTTPYASKTFPKSNVGLIGIFS